MNDAAVAGQDKHSPALLSAADHCLIGHLVTRIPRSLQSHHLTMLTLVWSGLVLAGYALAIRDRRWLFVVSALVAVQYVTDAVDGKLGALRGDGLLRWGFYADHFLDYVFLCSILLGYALLVPPRLVWLMMAILVAAIGFMVSSFLACVVEGTLGISYARIGPVEVRLLFIGINTWLALGGRAPLSTVLTVVLAVALVALCTFVAGTQARLWRADTANRQRQPSHPLLTVSRRLNRNAHSLTATISEP